MKVSEIFYSVQGEGPNIGKPAVFVRMALCNLRCVWCLSAHTKIATPEGGVKIKDLKKGDKVIAFDGKTLVVDEVEEVFVREVAREEMLRIGLDRKVIFATKEHPFFVSNEWVVAEKLKVGDELCYLNQRDCIRFMQLGARNSIHRASKQLLGMKISSAHRRCETQVIWEGEKVKQILVSQLIIANGRKITSIRIPTRKELSRLGEGRRGSGGNAERAKVYNLKVKNNHNYFANGFLTHNCDTKYTWDWGHYDYDREVKEMSLEEMEREILKYGCRHLVLTGGEPLIQQESLIPLLRSLKERGFYVEVETNGVILPDPDTLPLVDQWNVSPKLQNSGNPLHARERKDCYEFFRDLANSYFKYVIQSPTDLREVLELIERYGLPREKIILMPEATTAEELRERSRWLIEICKQHNYRFTTRLQVELWENRRGA